MIFIKFSKKRPCIKTSDSIQFYQAAYKMDPKYGGNSGTRLGKAIVSFRDLSDAQISQITKLKIIKMFRNLKYLCTFSKRFEKN